MKYYKGNYNIKTNYSKKYNVIIIHKVIKSRSLPND